MKKWVRPAAVALVIAAAWFLVSRGDRAGQDTVRCTAVHHGGSLTVLWQGRRERIDLPGRALELRYTDELRRQARRQGLSEREMVYRAWQDREELAEKVLGEYVRLTWPRGRGARNERGRLIAEVHTARGSVVASGTHAMGRE